MRGQRTRMRGPRRVSASTVSRRTLLAAAALWPILHAAELKPAKAADRLPIRARADWAGPLSPRGGMSAENAGDVKFLLVHHTASSNAYRPSEVAAQLRGVYRYHIGAKGWPDIAYNFLVDRFGTVWEGRMGSLTKPIKASATGGSQGFAQLACFLGDCSVQPPSSAATHAMLRLLAQLADRYAIDASPGSTAVFTSRGSNRWPMGQRVTTPTIAGHRDMSLTSCPGDGVYPAVRHAYPSLVTALRATGSSAGKPSASTRDGAQAAQPAPRGGERSPAPVSRSGRAVAAGGHSTRIDLEPVGIGGALLAAGAGTVAALRHRQRTDGGR
jgi:hypothetical protein